MGIIMNNAKQSALLLICMLATASLSMAQAAVVVSQPLDATAAGEFSNLGPSNQQAADDFTLSQGTILDSVSWYGRYGDASVGAPSPTDFSIRFFGDNAGTPEMTAFQTLSISVTPVNSGSSYTPVTGAQNIPWYFYTASLPALSLGADTYWLSILEDDATTALSGNTQWLWADSSTSGLRSNRNSDIVAWNTSLDIDHAFSLSGREIPVPAAVWLFGTALIGLFGFSKRRKEI
jgi:hypothetical protein